MLHEKVGIMVRFLRLMILSVVVILLTGQAVYGAADITQKDIDEGVSFCRDYPVAFTVDGAVVQPDVPPVIVKERTLVPARAVFEKMGASVSWDEDARMVEVAMGTSKTILTIDSDIAFVNGSPVTMEVPALIIGDRTMIPVRFVGESLACGVDWEPLTRTVMLTSPVIHERTQILSVEVKEKNDYYRVTIEGEGIIEGYKSFAYENPERFGVDIKSAVLEIEDDAVDLDGDMIIGLRYSQFEEDTVRVVVDVDV